MVRDSILHSQCPEVLKKGYPRRKRVSKEAELHDMSMAEHGTRRHLLRDTGSTRAEH
jgi:hypothetical protein